MKSTLKIFAMFTFSIPLIGGGPVKAQEYQDDYVGSIRTFAFNFCPKGYLKADGSLKKVAEYQELFSLIGRSFDTRAGNVDQDPLFMLPDLTGRVAIGAGKGYDFASYEGAETVTLAAPHMPPHNHTATFTSKFGDVPIKIPANSGNMTITSNLRVYATIGESVPKEGFFIGMGGSGQSTAPIFLDPSKIPKDKDNKKVDGIKISGVEVALEGTPANKEYETSVKAVTGGDVVVAYQRPYGETPSPVNIRDPSLALTVCIASKGRHPERP
ncbi:tail fiber protein [Sphingomonas sp. SORGH_AS_0870]|uniref:phage tail protein n=1 Tax=Sphingomonas sp. SORGH_AS_0870 TaxID=3041801 RepID=UPI00286AFE79|nr:tail fiber protein [Sphingomonas sp. SORGH_AS_0870]